jgi:hypothetical protein
MPDYTLRNGGEGASPLTYTFPYPKNRVTQNLKNGYETLKI